MNAYIDLDGTLLDSSQRHSINLNLLLVKYNIKTDISDYLNYKCLGNSTFDYLTKILKINKEKASIIAKEWVNTIENEDLLKNDVWYDEAPQFLIKLKNLGYKRILITARKNSDFVYMLIKNSSFIELDKIYVVSPSNAKKQKTDVIINQKTVNDIFIGDTETDLEAALEANIQYYMLNRGFRNKEFWNSKKIDNYSNLNEIYHQLTRIKRS